MFFYFVIIRIAAASFRWRNHWKSDGVRCRLYVGWLNCSQLNFSISLWVLPAAWGWAMSCSNTIPLLNSPLGIFWIARRSFLSVTLMFHRWENIQQTNFCLVPKCSVHVLFSMISPLNIFHFWGFVSFHSIRSISVRNVETLPSRFVLCSFTET